MNRVRKYPLSVLAVLERLAKPILLLGIIALWMGIAAPNAGRAQLTLDGTHCVVFSDIFVGELARCVTRRIDESTLTLSLIGRPPNRVHQIALKIDGLPPFQVIDVVVQPTVDQQDIGLLIADMDFDGRKDFAVMESQPAGPNVPYVYFLYDAETRMFQENADLATITAPIFDAVKQEIASSWRDGASRYGHDRYVWQDGRPVLTERIERRYDGKTCVEKRFGRQCSELKLLDTVTCSD